MELENRGCYRMSEKTTQPDRKGLPADYRGATPEQVALAVLRYRPGKARAKKRGKEEARR